MRSNSSTTAVISSWSYRRRIPSFSWWCPYTTCDVCEIERTSCACSSISCRRCKARSRWEAVEACAAFSASNADCSEHWQMCCLLCGMADSQLHCDGHDMHSAASRSCFAPLPLTCRSARVWLVQLPTVTMPLPSFGTLRSIRTVPRRPLNGVAKATARPLFDACERTVKRRTCVVLCPRGLMATLETASGDPLLTGLHFAHAGPPKGENDTAWHPIASCRAPAWPE